MIGQAGCGKSYWLMSQRADIRADCTNAPHRAILCTIADALSIAYPSRATVDMLTLAICDAPPSAVALDNIDRCGTKLQYSLLVIATRHEIIATATLPRRVSILTERTAATIIPPPRVSLSDVAIANAPTLTAAQVRRVSLIATTPAHAATLAHAIANGADIPTPPTHNNSWIMLIIAIAVIAYIRYTDPNLSPVTIAMLTAGGYILRRLLWRSL